MRRPKITWWKVVFDDLNILILMRNLAKNGTKWKIKGFQYQLGVVVIVATLPLGHWLLGTF